MELYSTDSKNVRDFDHLNISSWVRTDTLFKNIVPSAEKKEF